MSEEVHDTSIFDNVSLDNLRILFSDRDFTKFIVYLTIMIVLTYPLMDIITRSWNTGFMQESANAIRSTSQSGISFLINITMGLITGSIVLMFFDRKKKIQAIILTLGIIIILFYMINTFYVDWNLFYILPGLILGIIAGGGYKKSDNYGQAAMNVSIVSISYIMMSYLNIYFIRDQPTEKFFMDSIIVLAFAYFFGVVMNYEGKVKRIFILGPAKSGKTVFMVGCYKNILDKTDIPPNPNDDLLEAFNELYVTGAPISSKTSNSQKKPESVWSESPELKEYWLRETEETTEYEFTCEIGNFFPKEVIFRSTDYSGAFLKNIPDNMYKVESSDTDSLTKKYIDVAREIIMSDKLIFIIDADRHPVFEEIIHYIKITTRLQKKGKMFEPYIIVTKSDIFMEEFGKRDYQQFKEYVEKKLSKNTYIKMLFVQTSIRNLYPVFFDTEVVNGRRIPLRDKENGNVFIFGFDEFMSVLLQ